MDFAKLVFRGDHVTKSGQLLWWIPRAGRMSRQAYLRAVDVDSLIH